MRWPLIALLLVAIPVSAEEKIECAETASFTVCIERDSHWIGLVRKDTNTIVTPPPVSCGIAPDSVTFSKEEAITLRDYVRQAQNPLPVQTIKKTSKKRKAGKFLADFLAGLGSGPTWGGDNQPASQPQQRTCKPSRYNCFVIGSQILCDDECGNRSTAIVH